MTILLRDVPPRSGSVTRSSNVNFDRITSPAIFTGVSDGKWLSSIPRNAGALTSFNPSPQSTDFSPYGPCFMRPSSYTIALGPDYVTPRRCFLGVGCVVPSSVSTEAALVGYYGGGLVTMGISVMTNGKIKTYFRDGGWTLYSNQNITVPNDVPISLFLLHDSGSQYLYCNGNLINTFSSSKEINLVGMKHIVYCSDKAPVFWQISSYLTSTDTFPSLDGFCSDSPFDIYKATKRRIFIPSATFLYRRALMLASGSHQEVPTASLGTGIKPLVLMASGEIKERATSEGTPLTIENGSLRTLSGSETLEI